MLRTHYIEEIDKKFIGKEVTLGGWAHEIRKLGKINFVILRDKTGFVQVVVKGDKIPEEIINKISRENSLICKGIVKESKNDWGNVEISANSIEILGETKEKLPVDPTGKIESELETRLDYRWLDLRNPKTYAIFKIRAEVQKAFREKAIELGFLEINAPVIVGEATEGGTDLFEVKYFEKKAYLAQSPQLYKQMAVLSGADKVFCIMPVFRAEKHNTRFHLNESTQMDIEMGFAEEKDALEMLEKIFLHILKSVKENRKEELKLLKLNLAIPKIKRIEYGEAIKLLNKNKSKIKHGEDFTREDEEMLCKLLGDAVIITKWPTKMRGFYSMPMKEKPEICLAYDLLYRGLEIASGAQRVHEPELLKKQLKAHGLNPSNFKSYISAFDFGPIPHAGWSIGVERITQQICSLQNIREAVLFPRDRQRISP